MTLAHYGGFDEFAVIWLPVVLGVGLWLIIRTGKQEPERGEEDADVPEER